MPNIFKVALVTGSARRIGASIAQVLHDRHMNVVLHCHTSRREADALCATLNDKRPHSAIVIQADLLEIAGFKTLVEKAVGAWGRLDVLVNNASRFYRTPVDDVTEAAWDDLLNSNVKSPFFLSQAALPYLEKAKGCIVNITDIHGERPMREYGAYCVSKAALIMLTQSLAKDLGSRQIRVNAVSPGAILWPEGENVLSSDEKQKILDRTLLHRHGEAEEIAKAVLFLVEGADYITGQILAVDGGRTLMI